MNTTALPVTAHNERNGLLLGLLGVVIFAATLQIGRAHV